MIENLNDIVAAITIMEMPFGKYKGKSTEELWSEDEQYVRWISEEMGDTAIGICFKTYIAFKEDSLT